MIVDPCKTHHFPNAVFWYHPMAGLMSFSAHNGSRSTLSPRQWQRTHPANQSFLSLMSTACTSEEIHQLTLSHNIHLFCLPAHTTHRLQPLDVGIFGPLATAMAHQCDQIIQDTGAEIPVQDFVKEYMVARDEAF